MSENLAAYKTTLLIDKNIKGRLYNFLYKVV